METLKENGFSIAVVYVLVGVVIFPVCVLWQWLFWGIESFGLPDFYVSLATRTYPGYTIIYVSSLLLFVVLSLKKRKTKVFRRTA